jgi:hypothetical protein
MVSAGLVVVVSIVFNIKNKKKKISLLFKLKRYCYLIVH